MKSVTRLETQASLAPAHASAFMFIDAIDPEGTLNRGVYERIGRVFDRLAPYEPYLGGNLAADVAIYLSPESRLDFRENGVPVDSRSHGASNMALATALPHMNAVMGAAKALQEVHIPFAVVTPANLRDLGRYRVVLLPDALVMSDEEVGAFREFVARGGALYASGRTSLVAENGVPRAEFGLADVLGVSYRGPGATGLSFVTPVDAGLAQAAAAQEHLIHHGGQLQVAAAGAEVLAAVTLPYYPEKGGTVLRPSFSSIHSNPPGPAGAEPAICLARHGKGLACYAAGAIEAEQHAVSRDLVAHLVRRLLGGPARVEAEAPRFVELTVFEKQAERRLNLSLVALRDEDDCVPCRASVTVRLEVGQRAVALHALPGGEAHPYQEIEPGVLRFEVPELQILRMFELEYAA